MWHVVRNCQQSLGACPFWMCSAPVRIIEPLELEGTSKSHLVPLPVLHRDTHSSVRSSEPHFLPLDSSILSFPPFSCIFSSTAENVDLSFK